jgi:hypothetical protein
MFVVGMFLLAFGCALMLDTFIEANGVIQHSPRPDMASAQKLRRTRMAAVVLGLLLALGGLAMLLLVSHF